MRMIMSHQRMATRSPQGVSERTACDSALPWRPGRRDIGVVLPNMGRHLLKALVDATFDAERRRSGSREDLGGRMKLVAVGTPYRNLTIHREGFPGGARRVVSDERFSSGRCVRVFRRIRTASSIPSRTLMCRRSGDRPA
jgi:hypothetical protein